VALIACWLIGAFVRARRERARFVERERELADEAEVAVSNERARLARELHDIVSHNLSVVVVQAAGARAQGRSDSATLETIERSGRESLVEMCRLLGVLRRDSDDEALTPQPGPES
jgi:signal transduction histidine kinase